MIGRYIVDFLCLRHRLIVEADGPFHEETEARDAERDAWLKRQGFRVLRFPNLQIETRAHEVVAEILEAVRPAAETCARPLIRPPLGGHLLPQGEKGVLITGLCIENLSLQRGERVLFAGLSARVEAGEAVALTGANGAGKTSLLRAVAGFIAPRAGTIAFEGVADAEAARRTGIHLLGHQDGLKAGRTAREELVFAARWSGASGAAALAAAERLGLTRQLDLETRRLSAGQRRRLALARLIAAPRSLWLLDEPLAPLDQDGRALLGEIFAEHLARGGLILAAVHDPLPLAARTVEIAP